MKRKKAHEDPHANRRASDHDAVAAAGGADPAAEDAYWQGSYRSAPYVDAGLEYPYYQPAYRFGWEAYARYGDRSFDQVDETLMRDWDCRRGNSLQTWNEARDAARDAWERVAGQDRGRRRLAKRSSSRPPNNGRARRRS